MRSVRPIPTPSTQQAPQPPESKGTVSSLELPNPISYLLTVEQSADFLHLSTSTIRAYMRAGRLQGYRIAGKRKILIPRAALVALLQPTG
jgi:excisionase family DNA binding protein